VTEILDERDQNELVMMVPEGNYTSPGVPTLRFGEGLFVAVTAPRDELTGEAKAIEPRQWIVTDRAGTLRVMAAVRTISPVDDTWRETPTALARPTRFRTPREAHHDLVDVGALACTGFFDGVLTDGGTRAVVDLALRSLIPRALQPWLLNCCADFWTWLRAIE